MGVFQEMEISIEFPRYQILVNNHQEIGQIKNPKSLIFLFAICFLRLQKQLIVSILTKRYCGSPSVILSIKKEISKRQTTCQ